VAVRNAADLDTLQDVEQHGYRLATVLPG